MEYFRRIAPAITGHEGKTMSNTNGDAGPQTELHLIRSYAANLKRVSDEAGELLSVIEQAMVSEYPDNTEYERKSIHD